MTYTFGDTERAELRLCHLAEVYERSSREFLLSLGVSNPALCVDLGCGPGQTTELLHRALASRRTVGLDQSEPFIERAKQNHSSPLSFARHDVTILPLPVGPADVLYSRFLLTHLKDPVRVLSGWVDQALPEGRLALEELDHMRSKHPVLCEYYGIVEAMQTAHGQEMFIGRRLETMLRATPWEVISSRVFQFYIPGKQMARLHHLNIQTWKQNAFIREHYSNEQIENLQQQLEALARGGSDVTDVDYGMRQVVCRRRA
jgi:trans-aconitate 2-methyltransferase